MSITGILLAAGRGRRFDPAGERNKLLENVGGVPVAVASAQAVLAVLSRVVAVVGADDDGLAEALRAVGCDVVVAPNAGDGMAASLVHAIRHSLPAADAWLIALADMPRVAPSTIAALCAAIDAGASIAAPVLGGRRGNPVAFSSLHLPALLALEGDQGARAIIRDNPWSAVPVDDDGIFHDIDTPSDLLKTGTLPVSGQAERS